MDQRKAALDFVGRFCRADASGLEPLLAEDFHLTGPLARFESRTAYLAALEKDPPERAGFRVVKVFEEGADVCVIYELMRSTGTVVISQTFTFVDGKIADTLLLFDPGGIG